MPTTNERVNKREAILKSAYTIFTENGFHHARVSDIAKGAKVGKGTVYEYFQSKEDLLRGVVEEGIKYYLLMLTNSSQETLDPWEKIKIMIRKHGDILRENQKITKVIFSNFGIMTEEIHHYLLEQRRLMIRTLTQLVKDSLNKGIISPVDPEIGARLILGSMMAINCEDECLSKEEVDLIVDALEKGFRACPKK